MNESFTTEGYWWLPGTPEVKVPGILSFTPGDTPRLKLMGALNNAEVSNFRSPVFINPDIILGISAKGESVTLSKCLQINGNSNIGPAGSHITSEFIAHFAYFGVHFLNASDVQFTSITIRFHNLDNWYNKGCINVNQQESGQDLVTVNLPDPMIFNIDDLGLKILVTQNCNYKMNSASISIGVCLEIISVNQKPLDEYMALLRLLQNFFSFVITEPTFVTEMTGRLTIDDDKPTGNFAPAQTIKVYYAAAGWHPNAREIFWASMLMPYSEIESNLSELLNKWVKKADTIKPVYDLFFAGIYRSTYPENEFLNLIQAVETYHRRIYRGEYLPEGIYLNGLYKWLTAAIPAQISADFRSSLQGGKLRYAHEYSLRKRIVLLCRHITENLQINFLNGQEAISSYAEKITDTRNYLTHYSSELKMQAITGGKELFEVNNQLKLIISICFLEQMGIPYDKIETLISKQRQYVKYFSEQQDLNNS